MKKIRVYLDTSVLSHLFAEDVPEKMEQTNKLWQDFKDDKFEIFISDTTLLEIEQCPPQKKERILKRLEEIKYQEINDSSEIEVLAEEYLKNNVLSPKSLNDCMHIASAVVLNCDIIVSWNFKHLVNFKTINKVKIVNAVNNYKEISIMSPTMLISDEEEV